MFFTKGQSDYGPPSFKIIRKTEGSWSDVANEVRDWCNDFIPPHHLVSISLFEDAHPNEGNGMNACITHTAGDEPKPISEKAKSAAEGKPIYELEIIQETSEWDDMFGKAKATINAKGGSEGHLVSSTNDSSSEGGVVIVLSWKHLLQTNIQELDRPASCMEQCTIF